MKNFHYPLCACLLLPFTASAGVWAHYPFDSNFYDESGNFRDGILIDNGTTENSGIIGTPGDFKFGTGAMNFSADRDYLDIPSKTFGSGVPYTVAFWARKASGDAGQAADWDMVIGQRDNSNFFIALNDVTGTGMRWRSSSNAIERQADFGVAKDYEWHHYAIVAAGTTVTVYLDGAFHSSATGKQTGIILDTIGDAYSAGSDFDFHGQIDEMWIFDEALGADSIASLHATNNAYAAPPFAGFHHRYDDGFTDSSAAGNDGTAEGAAAVTTDPGALATGGGALALDGADSSRVLLASPGAFLPDHAWTVAWWARRGETGGSQGMVMGRAETTSDFIWLNDGFDGLRFRSSSGETHDLAAPKDMELHHYALVADGAGGLAYYLDGEPAGTSNGDTSFYIDSVGKAYPNSTFPYNFNGSLDEIHVMPTALGEIQVAQLYDAEKPGAVAPTIDRVRVVLLGGQSNADGRAAVSGLPTSPVNLQLTQADVDFFHKVEGGTATLGSLQPGLSESSQFGPEITLGRKLADLWAHENNTRMAIIKYANGGTNLAVQWKGGGDATTTGDGAEYVTFQQTVTAGLAALASAHPGAVIDLQGMVWMQGESDAVAAYAGSYQANLTTFIADVRATYGSGLPFVIARLSSGQTNLNATYLGQVRAAQDAVAAADPRTSILDTDGFGLGGDNLHFDASGQQSMGLGFATQAAYLEWVIDTFPPADIDAGLAEPGADRDGDGVSNWDEFLGGTDALSALSRFDASFIMSGPDSGEISYPSSGGRSYRVEQLAVPGSTWNMVLPVLRGTGSTVHRTIDASASRGIFRVRADLP
ncbi:LamG-like jellyroll fold domain-containing protein [Luteolibacter marinus]|uniref:LamG-like jellyroll fold domain-containing protein n=1 Tax=Luteolibacter marinus TaxID=2776705 RepID=UPI00186604B8|nr:LamG-like jellyroll fold domain-containing protein [Luteolibacter marinus]